MAHSLDFRGYDPAWPARFEQARAEFESVLPKGSVIEHVGSTAVAGLAAKDCIDILIVVNRDQLDEAVRCLSMLGLEHRPDSFATDPSRRFLRRIENGHRTQHVHLLAEGHPQIREYLAFRDLLRGDPARRQDYATVKRELARLHANDRAAYMAGKDELVRRLLRLALDEYAHRDRS
jgi:GrpB-like predicted nucleotidyltransferase (UPF0157 family)